MFSCQATTKCPQVCQNVLNVLLFLIQEIGWSVNGTSRRLVIFVTDAPFHIAGDGKVGIPVDNLTNT